jgi:hypothetical protein|nr:MAG TPA: hypothetical protein [Caudoviricetes sp.]
MDYTIRLIGKITNNSPETYNFENATEFADLWNSGRLIPFGYTKVENAGYLKIYQNLLKRSPLLDKWEINLSDNPTTAAKELYDLGKTVLAMERDFTLKDLTAILLLFLMDENGAYHLGWGILGFLDSIV